MAIANGEAVVDSAASSIAEGDTERLQEATGRVDEARTMPLDPVDLMRRLNRRNRKCEEVVQRTYRALLEKLKEDDTTYMMYEVMHKVIAATMGYNLDAANVDEFAKRLEALQILLEKVGGS